MQIGEYTLRNVRHGTFFQDAVMARRVPFAMLQGDPTVDEKGREVLGANSLLISRDGKHTLVFASMGSLHPSRGQQIYHGLKTPGGEPGPNKIVELPEALLPLGLTPDDISTVVMTHLEYDHAAGLLDAEMRPYCQNARHIVRGGELCYGMEKDPFRHFYPRQVLEALSALGDRQLAITSHDFEYLLHEGKYLTHDDISLRVTGGHTPYHQVVIGPGFMHLGDLMHDEHVLGAEQFNVYARNMDVAARAKADLLDRIVEENSVVFFNHGNVHHAGRIRHPHRWRL